MSARQIWADWAEVKVALEFMRDCGDRPGMYETAEQALEALDRLVPKPAEPEALLPGDKEQGT